jgi:hypothetical protein
MVWTRLQRAAPEPRAPTQSPGMGKVLLYHSLYAPSFDRGLRTQLMPLEVTVCMYLIHFHPQASSKLAKSCVTSIDFH